MEEKPIGRRLEHGPPEHARAELRGEAQSLWQAMTLYERFEQVVALVLSAIIALIVVVALVQLVGVVAALLLARALNPLEHETFELVFGMIMTLLIALELKHSIIKVALRNQHIVQVKTVVLIALIALARKFVVLPTETSPARIAALAVALLALGVVYWLMRERDDRDERRELDRKEREAGRADSAPPRQEG
jgi:uncharacterized membrane protein (DUF373 family)